MRYYNQGAGYRVAFSEDDADTFSSRWPCSTVEGPGWFEFDAVGNLVDRGGKYADRDGQEWVVFAGYCQEYGQNKHKKFALRQ